MLVRDQKAGRVGNGGAPGRAEAVLAERGILRQPDSQQRIDIVDVVGKADHVAPLAARLAMAAQVADQHRVAIADQVLRDVAIAPQVLAVAMQEHDQAPLCRRIGRGRDVEVGAQQHAVNSGQRMGSQGVDLRLAHALACIRNAGASVDKATERMRQIAPSEPQPGPQRSLQACATPSNRRRAGETATMRRQVMRRQG